MTAKKKLPPGVARCECGRTHMAWHRACIRCEIEKAKEKR